ncbi:hypothetical protein BC941DRAFT_420585 [Chlamydoabsidia padenii]|nr:hypothetical protein BC941DRAFT_420585 [Chlamydoabsidia padenii]
MDKSALFEYYKKKPVSIPSFSRSSSVSSVDSTAGKRPSLDCSVMPGAQSYKAHSTIDTWPASGSRPTTSTTGGSSLATNRATDDSGIDSRHLKRSRLDSTETSKQLPPCSQQQVPPQVSNLTSQPQSNAVKPPGSAGVEQQQSRHQSPANNLSKRQQQQPALNTQRQMYSDPSRTTIPPSSQPHKAPPTAKDKGKGRENEVQPKSLSQRRQPSPPIESTHSSASPSTNKKSNVNLETRSTTLGDLLDDAHKFVEQSSNKKVSPSSNNKRHPSLKEIAIKLIISSPNEISVNKLYNILEQQVDLSIEADGHEIIVQMIMKACETILKTCKELSANSSNLDYKNFIEDLAIGTVKIMKSNMTNYEHWWRGIWIEKNYLREEALPQTATIAAKKQATMYTEKVNLKQKFDDSMDFYNVGSFLDKLDEAVKDEGLINDQDLA